MAQFNDSKRRADGRGTLPGKPGDIYLAAASRKIDWRRVFFILLGLAIFLNIYFLPNWSDSIDDAGRHFVLTREGKAALGLFLLVTIWWLFEVVPIGVTAIAVGVFQALFFIRPAEDAFTDFMDPAIWFILGSLVIGMVFAKTGLTQRMACKMLSLMGERTSIIYLGTFMITATLTLVMAHTAVAATVFPLLMAIYSLYSEDERPTKFGKGLFMGMAFVCSAGSVVTLLGSARAPVAIGFFRQFTAVAALVGSRAIPGREISFFEMPYYMLPVGWGMVLIIWLYFMILHRPEKKTIPGLKERAIMLYARLGPISRNEIISLLIVFAAIAVLSIRSLSSALEPFDKSAIIMAAVLLFFIFKIISIKDLEELPLNIILLFGGAMSMGMCLFKTGAAQWLAVRGLEFFHNSPAIVFILAISLFVLIMTNFVLNVAVIALILPVGIAMAPYIHVAPEVILFSLLAVSGMPFLMLVGSAPNAIAYGSGQFTSSEFFWTGVPLSILLMAVLALFVWFLWPLMGMTVML